MCLYKEKQIQGASVISEQGLRVVQFQLHQLQGTG